MPKVVYIQPAGDSQEVNVPIGMSVMQGALNGGVAGIDADCGGACACATCHVYVNEGWVSRLPRPSAAETDLLEMAVGVREESRLSCQISMSAALDGLTVHLPESQR
jgi:2Fe-2S ferredoxin